MRPSPASAARGRERPGIRPAMQACGFIHGLLVAALLIPLTSPATAQHRQNPPGE